MKTIRNIGMNRGKARIWIEGAALSSMGWNKGTRYTCEFADGSIIYTQDPEGSRTVAGMENRPIIDTNTDKIRESLGDCSAVEIEVNESFIRITPARRSGVAGVVAAVALSIASIAFPYVSQFKRDAMSVLVACEESATVRDAFTARGHDAVSCDIQPTRNPFGWHVEGKVEPLLSRQWDLVIGFPPCTYFTNSCAWAFNDPDYERYPLVGYHQKVKADTLTGAARRAARDEALALVLAIWESANKVAVENPVGSLSSLWRKPDQIIQPWEYGHAESKGTCLWLKNLPALVATNVLNIEEHGWQAPDGKWRWQNQTASGQSNVGPSDERAKDRSVTYAGIALAMATQWG